MPTEITSYTTNEEVASIYSDPLFTNPDGSVNYDAIAAAIETETADPSSTAYDIEDLITAHVNGTGTLPPFMMAPEAYIDDPDAHPYLWADEVTSTLQQLGDLYGSANPAIQNFLVLTDAAGLTDSSDVLSEVEDFLESYGMSEEAARDTAGDIYNLFNVNDLHEVMTLFLSLGNPGIALLLYTAYGLAPEMQNLQDAALEVMEEGNNEMEDLLGRLEGLSSGNDLEDLGAQAESQAISQQLSVIATVLQTMTTFIQDAQQVIDQMLEMASQLAQGQDAALGTPIRNIAQ